MTATTNVQFLIEGLAGKQCNTCFKQQPLSYFHVDRKIKDGKRGKCKKCVAVEKAAWRAANPEREAAASAAWRKANPEKCRAIKAKRRTAKLQRRPAWSDTAAIHEFYEACPEGYHVDHIIPLQGRNVSGLHVLSNLQYLTPTENSSKGNRFNWKKFNGFK